MGLEKVTTPAPADSYSHGAGHNTRGHGEGMHLTIQHALRSLIRLDYVQVLNNRMTLTEQGRLLVTYLKLQGWVVDRFNDQVFTEGYKGFFEEAAERQRVNEASDGDQMERVSLMSKRMRVAEIRVKQLFISP